MAKHEGASKGRRQYVYLKGTFNFIVIVPLWLHPLRFSIDIRLDRLSSPNLQVCHLKDEINRS